MTLNTVLLSSQGPTTLLLKITLLLAMGSVAHALLWRANPRWRIVVWRIVIVFLPVLPVVPLLLPEISLVLPSKTESGGTHQSPEAISQQLPAPAHVSISTPATVNLSDAATNITKSNNFTSYLREHTHTLIYAVWLTVAVLLILRTFSGWLRMRRAIKISVTPSNEIILLTRQVAESLHCNRRLNIRIAQEFRSPFLTGIMTPTIILPQRLVTTESTEALAAVLAHEITHVKEKDTAWLALGELVTALLWFHPLAWFLCAAHRSSCESVCDGAAAAFVGNANMYASVLARVALDVHRGRCVSMGVPMLRNAEITRRLARIMSGLHSVPLRRRKVVALLAAIAPVFLAVACLHFAEAVAQADTTEPTVASTPPSPSPQTSTLPAWQMLRIPNIGAQLTLMAMRLHPYVYAPNAPIELPNRAYGPNTLHVELLTEGVLLFSRMII